MQKYHDSPSSMVEDHEKRLQLMNKGVERLGVNLIIVTAIATAAFGLALLALVQ